MITPEIIDTIAVISSIIFIIGIFKVIDEEKD